MVETVMKTKELLMVKNFGVKWSVEQIADAFLVKRDKVVLAETKDLEVAVKLLLLTASTSAKKVKVLTEAEEQLVKSVDIDFKTKECQF